MLAGSHSHYFYSDGEAHYFCVDALIKAALARKEAETPDLADRIVKAFADDFTDRRGLRQEWEQIDEETQAEIRTTWTKIVRKEMAKQ
jgi:hypothetical protein